VRGHPDDTGSNLTSYVANFVYRWNSPGGDHSVDDTYLPNWFSRWIMTGSTLVMIVAGCLVLWRTLTHRWYRNKND
jgi:hypothetical protein